MGGGQSLIQYNDKMSYVTKTRNGCITDDCGFSGRSGLIPAEATDQQSITGNGQTININNRTLLFIQSPGSGLTRTGLILEKGDCTGQMVYIFNNSLNTFQFAAGATSNIVGAVGTEIIASLRCEGPFFYNMTLGQWIPCRDF